PPLAPEAPPLAPRAPEAPPLAAAPQRPAALGPRRRPAAGETILAVDGLSKHFGGLRAVHEVGFTVEAGTVFGIIGPNGAGKTTLFNLLNGFIRPDAGRVALRGHDLVGLKPNRVCRLGIGRTFQVVRAFPRMSALENALIGAYVAQRSDREAMLAADAALARVGLGGRAGARAGALTTKELRLMELARALAGEPRLLLMDEPLAGLGGGEVEELLAAIRGLAENGITIVIIEHTMQAVVRLVDRLVVLDHGQVIAEGEPDAVTRDERVIEAYLGKKWAALSA
ncbi:MAG TPA: ATP-binding cassette domain-containing protein, partial [Stellaceae bacterium]|nr:ATP-binding cassette domain-containing protein [Stellaceae bacterium]